MLMTKVLWLRPFVGCLLVFSLLAASQKYDDAEAFQALPDFITEEMQRQLDDTGSVMISVTYRDLDPAIFQAQAQPANDSTNERDGAEVLAVLGSSHAAEIEVTSLDALVGLANDTDLESMVIPPYEGTFHQIGTANLRGAQRTAAIESAQMQARGHDGSGVTVAIVDTGVDRSHIDLVSSVVFEGCLQVFASGSCPDGTRVQTGAGAAAGGSGHGTQMASAVTSDGTITPLGMAPGASIEALRISATTGVDLRNALVALDFILEERSDVDIVMLSFGSRLTFEASCARDLWPAFFDTIRSLRERGVFVTASAGNDGIANRQSFPACLDDVHATTALNVGGTALAATANSAIGTDVAAPGSGIAVHDGGLSSGTSIANALVAGCAALAIDSGRTTPDEVGSWLQSPNDSVATSNGSVPSMQCAPYCFEEPATVNLALGETPTSGRDVILGTADDDVISAGPGNDLVCASAGNDLVYGGQGDDLVDGGEGSDRLWGNFGNDVVIGSSGDDTLHGGAGADDLRGQLGDDRLYGYSGDDVISGGQGADRLHGNAGADVLGGDSGDDTLYGYGGSDLLDGGIGSDICRGNAGADVLERCETGDAAR